jgi:hypothetical protein
MGKSLEIDFFIRQDLQNIIGTFSLMVFIIFEWLFGVRILCYVSLKLKKIMTQSLLTIISSLHYPFFNR